MKKWRFDRGEYPLRISTHRKTKWKEREEEEKDVEVEESENKIVRLPIIIIV